MESLGQQFKTARTKKKVTPSQAASATRMKVQLIEAMERDDFSRMAAPTYARGFIRLYAEYLGLDPAPLVQSYMDRFAPAPKPNLPVAPIIAVPEEQEPGPPARPRLSLNLHFKWPKIWSNIRWPQITISKPAMLAVFGVILAVLAVVWLINREPASQPERVPARAVEKAVSKTGMALVEEPPEPFIEDLSAQASTP
ncbi:MAG: helix-turn-helix domain-containing protein [Lentisphaerota bacterium]